MFLSGRFKDGDFLDFKNRRAKIVGRQVKDRDTCEMFDSHLSWAWDEVRFAVCLDSTTVPIPVCYDLPSMTIVHC